MHGQWSTYTNMMVTSTAILVLPPEPRVPPSSVHRPNSPTWDTFENKKETPRQGERTGTDELAANPLCLLVGDQIPSSVAQKTTYTAYWEPSVQISSKEQRCTLANVSWNYYGEAISFKPSSALWDPICLTLSKIPNKFFLPAYRTTLKPYHDLATLGE